MKCRIIHKSDRLGINKSFLLLMPRKECSNWWHCQYKNKCKFKSVKRRYFKRLSIQGDLTDLSGTTMCPYKTHRLYTCWDCEFCSGQVDGKCLNPNKQNEVGYEDSEWGIGHRCTGFTPDAWCNLWDRRTGERIY